MNLVTANSHPPPGAWSHHPGSWVEAGRGAALQLTTLLITAGHRARSSVSDEHIYSGGVWVSQSCAERTLELSEIM